jgi:hypothetical protein
MMEEFQLPRIWTNLGKSRGQLASMLQIVQPSGRRADRVLARCCVSEPLLALGPLLHDAKLFQKIYALDY